MHPPTSLVQWCGKESKKDQTTFISTWHNDFAYVQYIPAVMRKMCGARRCTLLWLWFAPWSSSGPPPFDSADAGAVAEDSDDDDAVTMIPVHPSLSPSPGSMMAAKNAVPRREASIPYSTCNNRPDGSKVVTERSYRGRWDDDDEGPNDTMRRREWAACTAKRWYSEEEEDDDDDDEPAS